MSDPLVAALIHGDSDDPARVRVGTVTGLGPVEVNIAGQGGLSANYIDSYTPAVGDVVLILQNSTELIIIGRPVAGG